MFDSATSPDGIYAILFTSHTCPQCPAARVRFSRARQGRAGVFFLEEDVLRQPSLAAVCEVHSVPALRVAHIVDGRMTKVYDPRLWEKGPEDHDATEEIMEALKEVVK